MSQVSVLSPRKQEEIRGRFDSRVEDDREIDSEHPMKGQYSNWQQDKFFQTQSQYAFKTGQLKNAYKKPDHSKKKSTN